MSEAATRIDRPSRRSLTRGAYFLRAGTDLPFALAGGAAALGALFTDVPLPAFALEAADTPLETTLV
jgi:hypothetical protein